MSAVLILTNTKDTSTDLVVEELRKLDVSYPRLNTDIAHESSFSFNIDEFTFTGSARCRHDMFSEISAIYMRRPDPPHFKFDGYEDAPGFTEFVENQWRALFRGLLSLTATWINPIPSALAAESKILQLRVARQIGLSVPETLITNSIDDVRCFVRTHQHFIAKALDAPLIETRHGSDFVYTQLFDSEVFDVDQYGESIAVSPSIIQRAILKKTDIRVTIVGEVVFAAEISAGGTEIDWRKVSGDQTEIKATCLPQPIANKCISLMHALGLRYGAIDLAYDGDNYFFLEINPSGEWGWLQHRGFKIAEAIAALLNASAE